MKSRPMLAAFSLAAVVIHAGWAADALAQQPARKRQLVVSSASDAALQARFNCFREGLASLEWTEGSSLTVQLRPTHGQPEEFANLRTARALALQLPASILMRVDRTFE